jgi:rsbT co-antagonist protein RsbR
MARRGLVTPAALIFIASLLLATLSSALSSGRLSVTPFYLLVSLLVASLTLRPWQIWLVLIFNVVGLTLTILALSYNSLTDRFDSQAVSSGFALLVVITLMSFLGAKTTNNALRGAEQARKEAEVAAQALERANTNLETTVAERTRSLEAALQAVEQREARLVQTLAENELQRETIREMSVPVIPVSTTTMVMQLIGTLDTARLADLRT